MIAILKNKQILVLFISGLAVLFTGMGLFPILPLFAAQFDASNSTIGFYLAVVYAANALGPVIAGLLISRFSKKAVFIISAAVGTPALVGLGLAHNFLQVIVSTSVLWFAGGAVMALVSIFTGLHTDSSNRGKAFSLMALVVPLGSLMGGAAVGQLVRWQGYSVMFLVLAVVWTFIPFIGWLFLKEGPRAQVQPAARTSETSAGASATRLGAVFARTAAFVLIGSIGVNVSRFGTRLSMQAQQFTPESVAGSAMVGGLIAIPATLAVGAYSDRLGRKHFLFASYLLGMCGSFILVGATALWQFWLASVLHMLAFSISGAMAQALSTEIVPAQAVSKALTYMNTLAAAASILCFAVGGVMYDLLGMPAVFMMSAIMALVVGVGIETLVRKDRGGRPQRFTARLRLLRLLFTSKL